jgi:copper resistance protein B
MSRVTSLTSILTLVLSVTRAQAAEDHAAHQHQKHEHQQHEQQSETQSEEHAQHQGHDQHGHDQHGTPAPDPHAQHAAAESEPTESERRHIPPDPPQQPLHDMSNERMIELMHMEDNAPYSMWLLDQLEWRDIDDENALVWDGQAWYGTDYNKAWFKTEGERVEGEYEGRAELLWDRIVSRWWSLQAGVRHDFGEGPSRNWAAFGVQGLAPYWFEVEATAYVGEGGRTAARFSAEYDLLLTQRLILQPEVEFELFGKDDPRNGIGSGLAESELGLRLRYEIRREFAPYIGVVWTRSYGQTADLARAAGHDDADVQFVAGLRAWF